MGISTRAGAGRRSTAGTRMRERDRLVAAGLAALLVAASGSAERLAAQTCAGGVTSEGEYAVRGDVNVDNGDADYGGGIEANMPGPLAAQASVAFTDETRMGNGQVTYDLTDGGVSVCPLVGANYRTTTREEEGVEVDHNRLRVPVGLTAGARAELSEGATLVPSAELGAFHDRFSTEGGPAADETDSDTAFFTRAGLTLGFGDTFFRGSAGVDTQGETDVDLKLSAGVRF